MEFSVRGQEHDSTVLPLRGDLVADSVRELLCEGADRCMARNVLRLEPQPALADETVPFAFDEHRFRDSVELRVFILPAEVPSFHQGVADHGPGRKDGQRGEGSFYVPPLGYSFSDRYLLIT